MQNTVGMGLLDIVVVGETIFVLAGYAHPDDDWGGDVGDTSSWAPWHDSLWEAGVHDECVEDEENWKDVTIEYTINALLIFKEQSWIKEKMPKSSHVEPCEKLRYLTQFGVLAMGEDGVFIATQSWKKKQEYEKYSNLVQYKGDIWGEYLEGRASLSTVVNITKDRSFVFEKGTFSYLTASPHGLYLAGRGLSIWKEDNFREIIPAKKSLNIMLSVTADIDGSVLAVSTQGDVWVMDENGEKHSSITLPKGFHVNLSVARFRGRNYVACKKNIIVGNEGDYAVLELPEPGEEDNSQTWSACGNYTLRVYEEKIWVLGAHHILMSENGRDWDFIDFSNHPI